MRFLEVEAGEEESLPPVLVKLFTPEEPDPEI